MDKCSVCGNNYDKAMEIKFKAREETFIFDCFECAIHKLAPKCDRCGCTIIGHGVESFGLLYCCAHCAKKEGVAAKDRI